MEVSVPYGESIRINPVLVRVLYKRAEEAVCGGKFF